MTPNFKAKMNRLNAAINDLRSQVATGPSRAGRPAGVSREAQIEQTTEILRTGRKTIAGKSKPVGFAEVVKLVLRLCKWGAGDRVPQEARVRYPWGNASREALAAAAEVEGVAVDVFCAAVGVGGGSGVAPVAALIDEPDDDNDDDDDDDDSPAVATAAKAAAARVVAMRSRARR
jgi:hypothetical protein